MRKVTSYSVEFKQNAVKKLLLSKKGSTSLVAKELGIPTSNLYDWKKIYGNPSSMNTKNTKTKLSPEEKLKILLETASMNEEEKGVYLRQKGLYLSDLDEFKTSFITSAKETSKGRPKLDPELVKLRNKNKKFEKEIKRKDKALAEYAARVILLKKSHEILGIDEDDE